MSDSTGEIHLGRKRKKKFSLSGLSLGSWLGFGSEHSELLRLIHTKQLRASRVLGPAHWNVRVRGSIKRVSVCALMLRERSFLFSADDR